MKVSVAVPWNLPCYIAANGFHPLYRALFEDNAHLEFHAIDEIALDRASRAGGALARDLSAQRSRAMQDLPAFLRESVEGKKFIRHLTADGIALCNEIPGEIELHHTSPLATGARPFVLHCESFLPIFFPFFFQGMGRLKDAGRVRELYRQVLRQDACLGIYSHVAETLAQIRRFFQDPVIDAKLHPSRIGLSQVDLDALLNGPRKGTGAGPVFLFTSSAHHNPGNFSHRGGYASLLFAERYLRAGKRGRFLFQAGRPGDAELTDAGIDAGFLRSAESKQLIWLEGHLPEHELLRLFMLADFLLLPSLNLHSVTLMRALAAGAIPVVTDTYGPEIYVTDNETGIVLSGVRGAAWHEDPETGIPVDSHEVPSGMAARLSGQLFDRITGLLDNPQAMEGLRARGRKFAAERLSGASFRDEFSESVARLWHAHASNSPHPRPSALASHKAILTGGWPRYFESPPQSKLLLDLGNARVYSARGIYLLKEMGLLGTSRVQLAGSLADFRAEMFFQFDPASRVTATLRHWFVRVREGSKRALRPHKRLYRLARSVNRQLRVLYGKLFRASPE